MTACKGHNLVVGILVPTCVFIIDRAVCLSHCTVGRRRKSLLGIIRKRVGTQENTVEIGLPDLDHLTVVIVLIIIVDDSSVVKKKLRP